MEATDRSDQRRGRRTREVLAILACSALLVGLGSLTASMSFAGLTGGPTGPNTVNGGISGLPSTSPPTAAAGEATQFKVQAKCGKKQKLRKGRCVKKP